MKLLLDIVITFIKIQLLSFGGGHASIPVVQNEVVEIKHWMTMQEFSDLLAMDEITPGPLAINCATFVGKKLAGVPGSIAATVGCIIPSCVIALIFSRMYKKYLSNRLFINELRSLRCLVIALLAVTTISLALGSIYVNNTLKIWNSLIFLLSFFLLYKYKPNPIYVILLGGVLGIIGSFF
ncbi:MAG: chromate transporter [Erysipelotrichaceae bacterium]|nr:chromate transporter [Erysipelotrichaceae bacterium]